MSEIAADPAARVELPSAVPRMQLSVSALRDYRRCPAYYQYKRIHKVPEYVSHHMAAGSILHASYYSAYATPYLEMDEHGRTKVKWTVHGDFVPAIAYQVFEALWDREPNNPLKTEEIFDKLGQRSVEAQNTFAVLADNVNHVQNFSRGKRKALQVTDQAALKDAWGEYYHDVLDKAIHTPLPAPIQEIERHVTYDMGGVTMIGYLDIVLNSGSGELIIDLKSGEDKPNTNELSFDDQMQSYYTTSPNIEQIYLLHMRSGELLKVPRNDKLIESLQEVAAQDALAISEGYFPKRFDKAVCSRCPYRKICHGT